MPGRTLVGITLSLIVVLVVTFAFVFGTAAKPSNIDLDLTPGTPRPLIASSSSQSSFVFDLHVLPGDYDYWQISENYLELYVGDVGAFPANPESAFAYIEQDVTVAYAAEFVVVRFPMVQFSSAYRVVRQSWGYRVEWYNPGLDGKKIALDPGHGGHDPGAVGRVLGLFEKDVTLAVSLELRSLLEAAGAEVFLTRTTDTMVNTDVRPGQHARPDWVRRRELAEDYNPDLFISIHTNSYRLRSANGTETYYNHNSFNAAASRDLTKAIHRSLISEFGRSNRGIKHKNDAVLQVHDFAAVLVELMFISNPEEERIMAAPDFAPRAARAIYSGITEYFDGPGGE